MLGTTYGARAIWHDDAGDTWSSEPVFTAPPNKPCCGVAVGNFDLGNPGNEIAATCSSVVYVIKQGELPAPVISGLWPSGGQTLYGNSDTTISWNYFSGGPPAGNSVQYTTDGANWTTLDRQFITPTTSYRWHVVNIPTSAAQVRDFAWNATGTAAPAVSGAFSILPTPGSFNLLTPTNHLTGVAIAGDLTWEAANGATNYDLYLDTISPPSLYAGGIGNVTTYHYAGLSNNKLYYWAVAARNANPMATRCAADFDFTTVLGAPGAFNLLTPADHAPGIPLAGDLTWEAASDAASYDVYYDIFASPTTLRGNVTSPTYSYTGLSENTVYYWKVVAKNAVSNTPCNADFDFTTVLPNAPGAFNLLSPTDHATGVAIAGDLTWEAASGAADYDVYLDTTSPPQLYAGSIGNVTTFHYAGLSNNKLYNWAVVARNVGGPTRCGTDFDFTTIVAAPGAFNLLSPADHAPGIPLAGDLTWEASSDVESYDVYYDIFASQRRCGATSPVRPIPIPG